MATLAGETFVTHAGHLWELATWLPGVADYENAPSEAKLRAAMTALATFHNAVADFAVADFELDGRLRPSETGPRSGPAIAPAIVTRLARVRDLEAGGAAALAQAISDSHWPKLAPLAQRFLTALPHAVPIAVTQLAPLADVKLPVQPCIRDVWHDHVLFDGDRVTGLVDFGAMQIDTPAIDVARLLGSLVREDAAGWRGGLSAYSAVRRLNEQETAAITALDTSGTILAGANWIRWIYAERRTFEMPEQVVVRFAKLLRRVERFNCPVSGGQSAAIEHGFGSP
jgi:homoserine kinase type II